MNRMIGVVHDSWVEFITDQKVQVTLKNAMGKIYGIEIGVNIRENFNDNKTQIVYVSAYDSYAMELFQVRPMNFLVKPIDKEKIEKTILLSLELDDASNLYFGFVIERKVVKVSLDSILYFECLGKKMRLVTRNKEYCFYGSKKDILAKVPEEFC